MRTSNIPEPSDGICKAQSWLEVEMEKTAQVDLELLKGQRRESWNHGIIDSWNHGIMES